MAEFNMPTEIVELPSKGIVYPEDNPLSSGKVEIKYMTAKEEDILTNQSYIEKGIVIDKVLKSVIVSKVNYDDLIAGDKNAIMVAARVLGYGGEYEFFSLDKMHKVDLAEIENKPLKEEYYTKGVNEFKFTLPFTKTEVTWKLLDGRDEKKIDNELEGLKKLYKDNIPTLSTRLKYIITSVNEERERKFIRDYVDKALLARDAKALRKHISEISPDVDLSFFPEGSKSRRSIPININFFGLKSSEAATIRVRLFRQIHNIVFHSNGGYDWHTIYNMPIWLRKFTWKELDDYYKASDKKIKEATEGKKGQTNMINSDGTVNVPEFAKASKSYKGKSSYK